MPLENIYRWNNNNNNYYYDNNKDNSSINSTEILLYDILNTTKPHAYGE